MASTFVAVEQIKAKPSPAQPPAIIPANQSIRASLEKFGYKVFRVHGFTSAANSFARASNESDVCPQARTQRATRLESADRCARVANITRPCRVDPATHPAQSAHHTLGDLSQFGMHVRDIDKISASFIISSVPNSRPSGQFLRQRATSRSFPPNKFAGDRKNRWDRADANARNDWPYRVARESPSAATARASLVQLTPRPTHVPELAPPASKPR